MKKYDLCVVGGGASGMVAALNAKKLHRDFKIIILEHLPRIGKKILATGNGRCNITNLNSLEHNYKNKDFATEALKCYPPERIIDIFREYGLYTYSDDEGRVYPRSNSAVSVLETLRYLIEINGIDVICEYNIKKIIKEEKFIINNEIVSDYLILACGGKSSSPQGSDGSGYALAKSLGHSLTMLCPSLVPLNVQPDKVRSLKGIRATNVRLTADCDDQSESTYGEILFTDSGVSGIAAMELAVFAEESLKKGFSPVLHIDFLPETDYISLTKEIIRVSVIKSGQPIENLLIGFLPKQVGIAILKNAAVYYGGMIIEDFSEDCAKAVANSIKDFCLEIAGTKGFLNSQVTSGGINVNEINKNTMESLITDKLYFCGEIIDVDGKCGGFNLQWAFSSGLLAGEIK